MVDLLRQDHLRQIQNISAKGRSSRVPHAFLHRKRTAPAAPRPVYRLIRPGRAGGKDMRSYYQGDIARTQARDIDASISAASSRHLGMAHSYASAPNRTSHSGGPRGPGDEHRHLAEPVSRPRSRTGCRNPVRGRALRRFRVLLQAAESREAFPSRSTGTDTA